MAFNPLTPTVAHGSYGQGKVVGILKVPHCKNKNLFKILKTTYMLLVIKLIIHIRYSVLRRQPHRRQA